MVTAQCGWVWRRRVPFWIAVVGVACVLFPGTGWADDKPAAPPSEAEQPASVERPPEPPTDPTTAKARGLFLQGVGHVKAARWGEALASFEHSRKLRPHATTTFNIGICERALARRTRAIAAFDEALTEAEKRPGELPPSLAEESRTNVAELRGQLARVKVTLVPSTAAIALDGRPLKVTRGRDGRTILVAGMLPAGPGRPPPASTFELLLDPGAHVITLSRKGFSDVVVDRAFTPGSKTELSLEMEKLPAVLRVASNVDGSLVTVNGKDVGPVPVEIRRPAGTYDVMVEKDGYDPHEQTVTLHAGENADIRASLVEESVPITKRWWFWTGAAAVVAGGVVLTYALTRPEPTPPDYDGGSTNWVVFPQGLRF